MSGVIALWAVGLLWGAPLAPSEASAGATPVAVDSRQLPATSVPVMPDCPAPSASRPSPVGSQPEAAWPLTSIDLSPGATGGGGPQAVVAAARQSPAIRSTTLGGAPAEITRAKAAIGHAGARVGWWGDSHAASGPLVNAFRQRLQAKIGDGGPGFVRALPPGSTAGVAGTVACASGGWRVRADAGPGSPSTRPYGPAGFLIESTSSADQGWIFASAPVNRIGLAFERGGDGGTIEVRVDSGDPMRVSTRGAGPGVLALSVPMGPHLLRYRPVGDGTVRIIGAFFERENEGIVVDNFAVGGRFASTFQRMDAGEFRGWLDYLALDLAIFQYGSNELSNPSLSAESYASDLDRSLSAIRSLFPATPCLLVGPPDRAVFRTRSRFGVFASVAWVNAAQATLGEKYGCTSWNTQAAMGGTGASVGWFLAPSPWMDGDLLHFTAAGAHALGAELALLLTGD